MYLSKSGILNPGSGGSRLPGIVSSIKIIRVHIRAGYRLARIFFCIDISKWSEVKGLSGYFTHYIQGIHVRRFTTTPFLQGNGKSLGSWNGLEFHKSYSLIHFIDASV